MNQKIELSEESVRDLIDLCQVVQKKNSKNEISVNMAKGISEYIDAFGMVSEAQALWLARNADFYKIKRPPELAGIVVARKVSSATPSASLPAASAPLLSFESQVVGYLSRIEQLLSGRYH